MSTPAVPRLAKVLLAATVVSFVAAIVRDVFGYAPPVLPHAWWDKSYNATEFFAAATCAVRAAWTTGPERAAWIAFSLGLGAYFAGDVYYTAALESLDSP